MDLIEFLRARLDEDEHLANELRKTCPHVDNCGDGEPDWGVVLDADRKMREVEAKRRVLDACECAEISDSGDIGAVLLAERVLSDLARPYADHPDYHSEWRP